MAIDFWGAIFSALLGSASSYYLDKKTKSDEAKLKGLLESWAEKLPEECRVTAVDPFLEIFLGNKYIQYFSLTSNQKKLKSFFEKKEAPPKELFYQVLLDRRNQVRKGGEAQLFFTSKKKVVYSSLEKLADELYDFFFHDPEFIKRFFVKELQKTKSMMEEFKDDIKTQMDLLKMQTDLLKEIKTASQKVVYYVVSPPQEKEPVPENYQKLLDESRKMLRETALSGELPPAVSSYTDKFRQLKVTAGLRPLDLDKTDKDLFNSFINLKGPIQVYAGDTNIIRSARGQRGLSPYMELASTSFTGYLKDVTGNEIFFKEVPSGSIDLRMTLDENLILLGGPVANTYTASLGGYIYNTIPFEGKEILLPSFRVNEGYRWGFFCGDTGYGEYKGEKTLVNRYEKNELVQRALYGIIDVQASPGDKLAVPIFFKLDKNDFLEQEVLLITRRQHPYVLTKYVLMVSGMHGYSTEAFVRDLHKNLEKLSYVVSGYRQYQVYIPVSLEHKHNEKKTIGHLEWDSVRIYNIN